MSKKETNDANASSRASGAKAQDTQTGVAAILNLKEELLAKVEEKAESQNAMINAKVDQLRKELLLKQHKADNLWLGKQVISLEVSANDL